MKKIFFSGVSMMFLVVNFATAQYDNYAALFGRQTFYGGTARYLSIGGAGTSLGGDLGAANINPAGLGMYRKSEFTFSPNFGFAGSNTTFLDESEHNNKGSFSISNFGVAICGAKDDLDESAWRGGTFNLGMSRTNSFHNRISFYGEDPRGTGGSSMADYFVQLADGTPEDDLLAEDPTDPNGYGIETLAGLAYWTYLIEPDTTAPNKYTNYLTNETLTKEGVYTTKGAQYQWNIAYGANYKDKLYIGGGIGITSINFKEDLSYTETADETSPAFNTFTFNDRNQIKGTGLNLKLGYIYKVSDLLKIGTTITTPTFYWMNQAFSSDLSTTYNPSMTYSGGSFNESTVDGSFKFNYTTPVKLAAGMSLFAGKTGFISGDVEYIPYQLSELSGRTSGEDRFLQPYNKIINNSYTNVVNLRIGGEVRADIIRLRAGLAYLPNPYKYSDGVDRNIYQISGGIGVKLEDVYFDLGLVNTKYQSTYQPYQVDGFGSPGPTAVSKNSFVNAVFTVGFYFE